MEIIRSWSRMAVRRHAAASPTETMMETPARSQNHSCLNSNILYGVTLSDKSHLCCRYNACYHDIHHHLQCFPWMLISDDRVGEYFCVRRFAGVILWFYDKFAFPWLHRRHHS